MVVDGRRIFLSATSSGPSLEFVSVYSDEAKSKIALNMGPSREMRGDGFLVLVDRSSSGGSKSGTSSWNGGGSNRIVQGRRIAIRILRIVRAIVPSLLTGPCGVIRIGSHDL